LCGAGGSPADPLTVRVSPCHARDTFHHLVSVPLQPPVHTERHSLARTLDALLLQWLKSRSGSREPDLHNPIVQSLEDLKDQKRKKKKEQVGLGSILPSSLEGSSGVSGPQLFDGNALDYDVEESVTW
jgi:hypothetical protein